MVIKKGQTKNNIDLVLWDFDYGTHFYSVMAYPIAQQTDYNNGYGARRGERICIDISFNTLEDGYKALEELENGSKTIFDYKDNIRNQKDLEFI